MEIKTDFRMLPIAEIDSNEGQVAGVKANPRTISEKDYKKLLKSLRASNLTDILPLKVYKHGERYVTIGGNMRLRALRELGEKEAPCIVIPESTPADVLNKAIILDNSTHGEWDWDMLANEWTDEPLEDWGVDAANWSQQEEVQQEDDEEGAEYIGEHEEGEVYLVELNFALKISDYNAIKAKLNEIGGDKNSALLKLAGL